MPTADSRFVRDARLHQQHPGTLELKATQKHNLHKALTSPIKTVAIIGAGTMGRGIAQACATAGFDVLLYDQIDGLAEQATSAIQASLDKRVDKGKISRDDAQTSLERISIARKIEDLRADLVIEAVVEDLAIKQHVLAEVERANDDDCLIASNTSSIRITDMASRLRRPGRFAGLHFFNPAPVMKLVEVVRGEKTTVATLSALRDFCERLGKQPVTAHDSPGFIVNRVARHFYLEALRAIEDDAADIKTIDELLRASGFRMGPFELMDLIGIDVNLAVSKSVYEGFHQAPRFRPSPIQQKKVDAGDLGRKTGRGFYEYDE